MLVTIDGPAGTGKSSVARKLSAALEWPYYNTGALYRALTAWMLGQHWIDQGSEKAPEELALRLASLQICVDPVEMRYWIDGEEMSEAIRDHSLSLLVSRVSAWESVRSYLLTVQRSLGSKGSAIFEGRDMGTVVFPSAEVKIYLTASAQERALRRYYQLRQDPAPDFKLPDLEQIAEQIELRDAQDRQRALSPLRPAEDAHLIDSTGTSIDRVVEQILALVHSQLER